MKEKIAASLPAEEALRETDLAEREGELTEESLEGVTGGMLVMPMPAYWTVKMIERWFRNGWLPKWRYVLLLAAARK